MNSETLNNKSSPNSRTLLLADVFQISMISMISDRFFCSTPAKFRARLSIVLTLTL